MSRWLDDRKTWAPADALNAADCCRQPCKEAGRCVCIERGLRPCVQSYALEGQWGYWELDYRRAVPLWLYAGISFPSVKCRPTKNKKARIIARDGGCAHCGAQSGLEVHHKVQVIDGGGNEDDNLVALCDKCHLAQHDYLRQLKRFRAIIGEFPG